MTDNESKPKKAEIFFWFCDHDIQKKNELKGYK